MAALMLTSSPSVTTATTAPASPSSSPSPSPSSGTGSTNTGPFLIVAAVIALVGVAATALVQWALGKRTIRLNTQTADRIADQAKSDEFAKRYQEAATLLGDDQAPVRLAGAYAMARLGDDWEAERQTCVDVLCAYLRMPWQSLDRFDIEEPPEPPETQVRHTIIRLIASHVRNAAAVSWSNLTFDLRGAKLASLRLEDAKFTTHLDLRDCEILEKAVLRNVEFEQGASFLRAHFVNGIDVHRCTTNRGFDLSGAIFPVATESSFIWDTIGPNGALKFDKAGIGGKLTVILGSSRQPQGSVILGFLSAPGDREVLRIAANTLVVGGGARNYPKVTQRRSPTEYRKQVVVEPPLTLEIVDDPPN